jgi:hypothetical protein
LNVALVIAGHDVGVQQVVHVHATQREVVVIASLEEGPARKLASRGITFRITPPVSAARSSPDVVRTTS